MAQRYTAKGYVVHIDALPPRYPTHRLDAAFWESLGRTVATFGFLEEVLGKAIFSFTATKPYGASEIDAAFARWLRTLQRALRDPLAKLIKDFGKSVREHPQANAGGLEQLLSDLLEASKVRNVLCHGSWQMPDANGASIPFFVDKGNNLFDTPIDRAFLDQVQRKALALSCKVINSVTQMGWQFPGSSGPGIPIDRCTGLRILSQLSGRTSGTD